VNPIIEFANVKRAYKAGTPVLDGVSFEMSEGEVTGLLGRNGAGKTTLIRLLMGQLFPQGGEVRVFGLSPTEHPVEVKRRIGFVAEDQVLPAGSRVEELIDFHKYLFPKWDEALERQLLDRFGIGRRDKVGKLSKGQARQVALLCALCHRPELLVLDEPAGGLDPAARREFLEASIQLLNREGCAILFSSHHMNDVERLGGRVLLLDGGKLALDEDLDHLRERLCVALVPRASADEAALLRVEGCLRARLVADDWHAVYQGDPATVTAQLKARLGSNGIRCARVPLEELFVEMVGGKH